MSCACGRVVGDSCHTSNVAHGRAPAGRQIDVSAPTCCQSVSGVFSAPPCRYASQTISAVSRPIRPTVLQPYADPAARTFVRRHEEPLGISSARADPVLRASIALRRDAPVVVMVVREHHEHLAIAPARNVGSPQASFSVDLRQRHDRSPAAGRSAVRRGIVSPCAFAAVEELHLAAPASRRPTCALRSGRPCSGR